MKQADQIVLLKSTIFDLAIIDMAQNVSSPHKHLDTITMLAGACKDEYDKQFLKDMLHCLNSLASLNFNDTETALIDTVVLIGESHGDNERRFVAQLNNCLAAQLSRFSEPDDVMQRVTLILQQLRKLARLHVDCLRRFRASLPNPSILELPALYSELFSPEVIFSSEH